MTKQNVIDLVKDAGYGFLATDEGNQPRVRPVGPYLSEDGELLIAILSHSRSIQQIQKNPMVELCFVDRKMAFCRITGQAKISQDAGKRETVWNHVPQLKQYASGPQDKIFTLVEVNISAAESMSPSDKTPQKVEF
ncbi:MAG: pyridoxamine 5'-phosphate oxidase family protein [Candidatus Omnitrophota bacterium]